MMQRALLCWLILTASAFGQGLTVGGPLQSPVYKIVRLKAENPAKDAAIVWDVLDEGADAIEIDGELFFTGPPGRYRIVCTEITIVGTKPAVRRTRVNVEITGNAPVPPEPPKPGPADPLLGKLRAVYTPVPENVERVKRLIAIYKVASQTTCFDTSIGSLVQLYNIVATASGREIPLPILEAERNIIAAELRSKLPTKDQELTKELRDQVASEFNRIATVLGELIK